MGVMSEIRPRARPDPVFIGMARDHLRESGDRPEDLHRIERYLAERDKSES